MIQLRKAAFDHLAFILALEKRFADLGFLGPDSGPVHAERFGSPDSAYFLIERNGLPAGFVILRGLRSNRSIELKRVAVSEPGQGIGREALRQVIRKAFNQLAAHRLWLDVFSDNHRARATYRALGFVEEGTQRECVWYDNRFRSLVLMSMLEEEFHHT